MSKESGRGGQNVLTILGPIVDIIGGTYTFMYQLKKNIQIDNDMHMASKKYEEDIHGLDLD